MEDKEMTLSEFIEMMFKENPFGALEATKKLIELEAIEHWMNIMWGVNLDIKIKPTEQKGTDYIPQSLIEAVNQQKKLPPNKK